MNNILEKIKQATIFENLNDQELKDLLSISTLQSFNKNNIIFYKDDSPKYLHLLLDGTLKIYKHNLRGNEVVIKTFNTISLIAELANLEQINYPSNCIALSDCTILLIDYKKLSDNFLNKPQILLLFIKSLTKKIIFLEQNISENLTLNATAKVAKYIYEFEKEFLKNSHIKTASLLNITPETLSRIIKKFKEKSILSNELNRVKINKIKELKKYFIV